MSLAVSAVQTTGVRSGLCPHGLPVGACPICSGGMGSNKVATADFSALRNARLARESDYQNRIIAMAQFQNNMAKMAQNLQTFIQNMSQSALTRPLAMIAQNVLLPVVKFMKDLPVNFLQATANVAQKLADITDKLTAIYGELKASMDKKFSDFAKKVKKKILSIFEIFKAENESSDDERIEDYEKQLNKLKTLLEKITNRPTKYKELNSEY